MSTPPSAATGVSGALVRYRVMAVVVGIGLIVLVFVGIPLQIWADNEGVVDVVGPLHGFLYIVYLAAGFDLVRRARWPFGEMVWMVLAGLIPFAAFVEERRVTHHVERDLAARGPAG